MFVNVSDFRFSLRIKKNPMWRPCPSLYISIYTFSQINIKLDTEALQKCRQVRETFVSIGSAAAMFNFRV
jgi:hypothetical protein